MTIISDNYNFTTDLFVKPTDKNQQIFVHATPEDVREAFRMPRLLGCNRYVHRINCVINERQSVTSSNVLRKVSLQTKLNAGLSEQQQEDLFQSERSFHEVKLLTTRT